MSEEEFFVQLEEYDKRRSVANRTSRSEHSRLDERGEWLDGIEDGTLPKPIRAIDWKAPKIKIKKLDF